MRSPTGPRTQASFALLVGLTVSLLAACSSSTHAGGVASNALRAQSLDAPIAKPALTLTDTSGRPYDLRARTAGRLTLLYFGYTHCPDVCPTTMANIAIAERQLAAVRSKVTVVFITTDPQRDSPAVLKSWLAHFPGGQFVGLTGSEPTILGAAKAVGVPLEAPKKQADGSYAVMHGAQVLAFSPSDNAAHAVYTAQASSDDYAHDLPLLVAGQAP